MMILYAVSIFYSSLRGDSLGHLTIRMFSLGPGHLGREPNTAQTLHTFLPSPSQLPDGKLKPTRNDKSHKTFLKIIHQLNRGDG